MGQAQFKRGYSYEMAYKMFVDNMSIVGVINAIVDEINKRIELSAASGGTCCEYKAMIPPIHHHKFVRMILEQIYGEYPSISFVSDESSILIMIGWYSDVSRDSEYE